MSVQKRSALSLAEKVKLISEIDKGVKKKKEIAIDFGIPSSTLSTIIKNREKILKIAENGISSDRKRVKICTYNDIDEAVLDWVKMVRDKNESISGPIIREKALAFAKSLGHVDFIASVGWLDKFKKRHNIVQKIISGDVNEINNEECRVMDYPSADEILKIKKCEDEDEDSLSDAETSTTVPNPPSDNEMRHILNRCSEYLCSKETVPDEVCRALITLENYVENEYFTNTTI